MHYDPRDSGARTFPRCSPKAQERKISLTKRIRRRRRGPQPALAQEQLWVVPWGGCSELAPLLFLDWVRSLLPVPSWPHWLERESAAQWAGSPEPLSEWESRNTRPNAMKAA